MMSRSGETAEEWKAGTTAGKRSKGGFVMKYFLVSAIIDETNDGVPVRVEAENTTTAIHKAFANYYINHEYNIARVNCYEILQSAECLNNLLTIR